MTRDHKDPVLLTPGPLTTSPGVKAALARDWGSRDRPFIEMTGRVRIRLAEIAGAEASHECVLLQGSGTFAIEAALGSLVPRAGKVLVLVNGTYGRRIVRICELIGRAGVSHETPEDTPPDPEDVDRLLVRDPSIPTSLSFIARRRRAS